MNQTNDTFDRSSAQSAESVMSAVCPDPLLRREVLRYLLDSIGFAETLAPGAWAVTLFSTGFRLNVGPVEALTCELVQWPFPPTEPGDLLMRVLTQGELPEGVLKQQHNRRAALTLSPAAYKSVALPQHVVALVVKELGALQQWLAMLLPAHQRYISQALHTSAGRVRSSTAFRRTHSPGLMAYAQALCAEPLEDQATTTMAMPETEWDEAQDIEFYEGRPIAVKTTRYERDPHARRASLAHHGYSCSACGFNFGAMYGPVAAHYIQVHHLNPVASHGKTVLVNPITDLRPLCANCHAVAHFRNPPFTIEEIIAFINQEQTYE